MATRKQIADDLRTQCGKIISFGVLSEYLGMCPKAARKFLADVPSYNMGNKRCFFPIDVARKLESCEMTVAPERRII